MDYQLIYEWIGYVGSLLIAFAMTNNSILRLRWYSLVGNIFFVTYGILISAYPVALVNFFIAGANIYFIQKLSLKSDYLKFLNIKPSNLYLKEFLNFHGKELFSFFPNFKYFPEKYVECAFILRDMNVAGLFLASKQDETTLLVELDFVAPAYRDFRIGKFIFNQHLDYFVDHGYTRIISPCYNRNHEKYLEKVGFVIEMIDGKRMFVKYLVLTNTK